MERGWPSGPRLPVSHPIEDLDPAAGGCFNCGDKTRVRLRMFRLVDEATGKLAGRWRLCQSCWEWGAPRPPDPDPLEVTDAA